jgi:hypothetical protein
MFHLCSYGSRNVGQGAKPRLEGAHAMRQRLSRRHEVHQAMRLPETTRPRDARQYARAQLPAVAPRVEAYVSSLWKSTGYGRVRTADQSRSLHRMMGGPDGNDDLLRRARVHEVS